MTQTTPRPRLRRSTALRAAGLLAVLVAALSGVTTAYAAWPAPARPSAATLAPRSAAASCEQWQTPTTVPPKVTLTPRIFPPASLAASGEPPTSAAVPTTSRPGGSPRSPTTTSGEPRVVCRNAPPTPFTQPSWTAGSVVGGDRLGASGVVVDLAPGAPPPPEVYDVSYVVADLDSGEILAAKSPHAWLRPASTLKALTALTLLPRLDPRTAVVASEEAQAAAGSRVGILAGNRYTVSNLVDAMMMMSANDAVYALADAAGGYDRTVTLMNEAAREIGAHDTVVVDPSGLDEGNQRSSAYDLALIAREAMRMPAFRAAIVKRDAVFPGGKDQQGKVWKPFHIYNINEFLRHYDGAIGIKPGRTDRAQHTFIGAATRGGRTLVVTQMGSITGSWKPTAALLDWGFANADTATPVGTLVPPGEAGPPVPLPSLTSLPGPTTSATAAATTVTPLEGGETGTPSPEALSVAAVSSDPQLTLAPLLVLGGALSAILASLLVVHRRRRRGDGRT